MASAFFLPGKDNGSIGLIDMTDKQNTGCLMLRFFVNEFLNQQNFVVKMHKFNVKMKSISK